MDAESKQSRSKADGSGTDQPPVKPVPAYVGTRAQYPDDAEISLYDIWRIVSARRALVLGITLLAAVASGLVALLMTPAYRAEVLLAPVTDPDEGERYLSSLTDFGNIAALAGINLNKHDRKSESIATLKSRRFGERFIQENKLDKILFADLWDEKHQRWAVNDSEDVPTLWDAYKLFDDDIRQVREDRGTGLVTLSIEWRDPHIAAQWANKLVARVNATLRQEAVDTSKEAIAYLQEQLGRTSVVELQQVLHRFIEAEMKKSILANINEEYAFKVIDPAKAPEEPFKPKALLMVIVSTAGGLMLGLILALILNAVRTEPGTVPR